AYSEHRWPGSTGYLRDRVENLVIPSILTLRQAFDTEAWPVIYLRLCGTRENRSDLHRFFRKFWTDAEKAGFKDCYPLASDPWASVVDVIKPRQTDQVLEKTGFSGFNGTTLEGLLRDSGVGLLVMTGLATSQCVDTTARDGSDRGFTIVQVHDAQADYSEDVHQAALYASCGVCGVNINSAEAVSSDLAEYVGKTRGAEL
ncbi:MAG: isochorismatase family cysteine hydrolase, partial [Spirochaetota bacterium]